MIICVSHYINHCLSGYYRYRRLQHLYDAPEKGSQRFQKCTYATLLSARSDNELDRAVDGMAVDYQLDSIYDSAAAGCLLYEIPAKT